MIRGAAGLVMNQNLDCVLPKTQNPSSDGHVDQLVAAWAGNLRRCAVCSSQGASKPYNISISGASSSSIPLPLLVVTEWFIFAS